MSQDGPNSGVAATADIHANAANRRFDHFFQHFLEKHFVPFAKSKRCSSLQQLKQSAGGKTKQSASSLARKDAKLNPPNLALLRHIFEKYL
jgi:hypothetical protein